MNKCPNCRNELDMQAVAFCTDCGFQLVSTGDLPTLEVELTTTLSDAAPTLIVRMPSAEDLKETPELSEEELRILDHIYSVDRACSQEELQRALGISKHYDAIHALANLCDKTKYLRRIKGQKGVTQKLFTGETRVIIPSRPRRYALTVKGIALAKDRKPAR